MKKKAIFVAAVLCVLFAISILFVRRSITRKMNTPSRTTHIVLIGASIGRAWHLEQWSARVNAPGFSAESLAAWQFDKSEAVDEVLMRPSRKFRATRTYLKSLFQPPPRKADIVILKECSSYFPGDLALYKSSMVKWIGQLQSNHSRVILATVVPVTRTCAEQAPSKQESLVEFNQWIREYAGQNGLEVLDLESAMRTSDTDKYLRGEFATSDGSHLNPVAYAVLDEVLRETLSQSASTEGLRHQTASVMP